MKLETINKALNIFLVCLVVQVNPTDPDKDPTRLYLSTIFKQGYIKNWPHIRLLTWLGF